MNIAYKERDYDKEKSSVQKKHLKNDFNLKLTKPLTCSNFLIQNFEFF